MDVGCHELDNTVWSSKRTDSDQQRSVVLPIFFSLSLKKNLLAVSKINYSVFFSSFIVVKYLFFLLFWRSCWSKWDFPKSCVCREALKVILTCCQAGACLWGCLGLLTGLSCDHDFSFFFPLLLPLSNFSLSSRNDLLLLFLVQSLIFLSKVSQNLSGKTCWRAPWRSPVWNLADRECLDWGENYDCEWGWKGMQGETTLENWHFWKTRWCSLIFQHRYLFFCFFLDWE